MIDIDVIWAAYGASTAGGKWDQTQVADILADDPWLTNIRFVRQHRFDDIVDGAVVVVAACDMLDDQHIDQLNRDLARLRWVVLVATSDERGQFPWERIEHPNLRLWWMTPDPERLPPSATYLGEGYPPGTRAKVAARGPNPARPNDWFFAGQVTHRRRVQCTRSLSKLGRGGMIATEAFAEGVPHDEYMDFLLASKVVPCPAGTYTIDSFRIYEALEAGAVPVLDRRDARLQDRDVVWGLIFGDDHPFRLVYHWQEFRRVLDEIIPAWADIADQTQIWWGEYKRRLVTRLETDVCELAGHPTDTETLTVVVNAAGLPSSEIAAGLDVIRAATGNVRSDFVVDVGPSSTPESSEVIWMSNHRWERTVAARGDSDRHVRTRTVVRLELR